MVIGTINIWGLFGEWTERKKILEKSFQKSLRPDILCLQEVCKEKYIDQLEDLQGRLGYKYAFMANSIVNECNSEGVAFLTNCKPEYTREEYFRPAWGQENVHESRVSLIGGFRNKSTGKTIEVISTHLSYQPRSRNNQQLRQLLSRESPTIIAGDLNVKRIFLNEMLKEYRSWRVDGLYDITWPSDIDSFKEAWAKRSGADVDFDITPSQLDYIITNTDIELKSTRVNKLQQGPSFASDHFMIVNEYKGFTLSR